MEGHGRPGLPGPGTSPPAPDQGARVSLSLPYPAPSHPLPLPLGMDHRAQRLELQQGSLPTQASHQSLEQPLPALQRLRDLADTPQPILSLLLPGRGRVALPFCQVLYPRPSFRVVPFTPTPWVTRRDPLGVSILCW